MPKHARKKKDGRALRPFRQAPTAKAGRSSQTINHILYFIGRGNWFLKESLGKAKIKEDMVFKCIGGRADNHVLPRRHQVVRWLLCWFWHQYHDLCAYQRPWATAASVLFGSLDSTGFLAKPSSVVHLLGDGSITNVWMLLLVLPSSWLHHLLDHFSSDATSTSLVVLWPSSVARRHQLLDHPPLLSLWPSSSLAQRHFCAASATQVYSSLWKKAQSEGKDGQGRKVAGAEARTPWRRNAIYLWNLICMSSTCSFCRIFNDYSESQLMDNNSFDVRWVTAHGPRHSALVKPFLEKRGPQGLEPWGVMCFGWGHKCKLSPSHFFCWVSCIPKQLIMQRCA